MKVRGRPLKVGRFRLMNFVACVVMLTCVLASLEAHAQEAQLLVPQPYSERDRHGVDVMGGAFSHAPATLSIGPRNGGLSFRPVVTDRGRWTHNFMGSVVEACDWHDASNMCELVRGAYRTVTLGDSHAVVFEEQVDGSWAPTNGQSATLTGSGGNWTFVAHDGTIATFAAPTVWEYTGESGPNFKQTSLAALRTLTRPSGLTLTYHYRLNAIGAYTLSSVTSNTGYQLFFEAAASGVPEIAKAIALNTAVEACDPTAPTCTPAGAWPMMTLERSSGSIRATDALGRTTYYNFGPPAAGHLNRVIGVRRPGRTTGYDMTFLYRRYVSTPPEEFPFVEPYGPVASVATDDGLWKYKNAYGSWTRTVENPQGHAVIYEMQEFGISKTARLHKMTDELGRVWTNTYEIRPGIGAVLLSVTRPEGDELVYNFDTRGNVTEERMVSKAPGSPADIVRRATYPSTCANPVTCNLPTSITDARGGV
ncbi:hypothetical protein, partial [Brevundimonas sp. P7753]|uniref:hypothetical protein n=1 Tax=Brevundimonas sp. P7753 TaxID=2726982 RepID=UPI0015BAD924